MRRTSAAAVAAALTVGTSTSLAYAATVPDPSVAGPVIRTYATPSAAPRLPSTLGDGFLATSSQGSTTFMLTSSRRWITGQRNTGIAAPDVRACLISVWLLRWTATNPKAKVQAAVVDSGGSPWQKSPRGRAGIAGGTACDAPYFRLAAGSPPTKVTVFHRYYQYR